MDGKTRRAKGCTRVFKTDLACVSSMSTTMRGLRDVARVDSMANMGGLPKSWAMVRRYYLLSPDEPDDTLVVDPYPLSECG